VVSAGLAGLTSYPSSEFERDRRVLQHLVGDDWRA